MLASLIYINNWVHLETPDRVYLSHLWNKNHLALSEAAGLCSTAFNALAWSLGFAHQPFCLTRLSSV